MPIGSLAVVRGAALRRSVRGVVIGLVMVASGAVGVPAALAVGLAGADVPQAVADFTVAGPLSVQLAAVPAPPDLDLSGARFEVLDGSGAVVGSCDTGVTGACDIPTTRLPSAPTPYRLVQDAGSPVPGLVPSSSVSTFSVCAADCPAPAIRTVTDGSLFRVGLAVTVQDAASRAPVPGAEYSLTGPDYRHSGSTVHEAATTRFPDNALSGSDGLLTFSGWLLPGDWSLTPEVTPSRYRSSGVLPLTLPAPASDETGPLSTVVGLAADVPDMGSGLPPVPPVPPAPAPPAAPGPEPVPAAHPAVAVQPAGSAPDAVAPAVQPAPPAASATPESAPAGTDPGPALDHPAVPPASADPGAAGASTAPLQVAAGTSSLDLGLIGFVALFVTLTVFGAGYLRRRARS